MTQTVLEQTLRTLFQTQIAAKNNLPTQYDNTDFDKPQDKDAIWARVSIKQGQSEQVSSGSPGNNRWRSPGVLFVQLFGPVNRGDGLLLQLADKIVTLYRGTNPATNLWTKSPYVTKVGRSIGDQWQVNVTCPYVCDDLG